MSNEESRRYIRSNFDMMETAQLLEIWQKNDRVEYTDLAFEVLHDLLAERGCEIPAQCEAIRDYSQVEVEEEEAPDLIERIDPLPEMDTDDAGGPAFYTPASAIRLTRWLDRIAIIMIVINVVGYGIDNYSSYASLFGSLMGITALQILNIAASILYLMIECAVIFFTLKALGFILKMVMEMEFTSRKKLEQAPEESFSAVSPQPSAGE